MIKTPFFDDINDWIVDGWTMHSWNVVEFRKHDAGPMYYIVLERQVRR